MANSANLHHANARQSNLKSGSDKKSTDAMPVYPSETGYQQRKDLHSPRNNNIIPVSRKPVNRVPAYSLVSSEKMKNVKTKQLKHHHISQKISLEILTGRLLPGQRIPTEQELAKAFGASRPTVGRALRELQNQGLICRRQGAGSFVNAPENNKLRKIGALMGFCHDTADRGIFGNLLSELSHACTLNNYSFVLTNYPADDDEDIRIKHARMTCTELIKQQVDSVLFMPMDLSVKNEHVNHEIASSVDKAGISLVLLDRDIYRTPNRSRFDRVGANNELAAQVLTQHLINNGCRKIDMVMCMDIPPSVQERMTGYQKVLLDNGLGPTPQQYHKIDTHDLETVERCLDSTKADALLCINDEVAALVMRSLLRRGIKVPEDVKVVGFDDLPISSYLPVPLTTVRQPVKDIAHEAFRTIATRLEDPGMAAKDVLLKAELVIRESCGSKLL